ncbi:hypothetical protein T484DRAFT_1848116, partial [Baffinella frigidus]
GSPTVRLGYTAAEASFWLSHSSIISRVPWNRAPEVTTKIVVSVESQRGTAAGVFSFHPPQVDKVVPSNAPKSGRHLLTLLGKNFGTYEQSAWIKVGNTRCIFTQWHSDSRIMCLVPPGMSARVTVFLEDEEGEFHSDSDSYSYDRHFFTNVSTNLPTVGRYEVTVSTNLPTVGRYEVTIPGVSFGYWQDSPSLRAGFTGAEATTWVSDTSIKARLAAGVAATLPVQVTIARLAESVTHVLSYDAPTAFAAPASKQNLPPSLPLGSGMRVDASRLHGTNVGTSDVSAVSHVGGSTAQRTAWTSDTALSTRLAPGLGGSLRLAVTCGGERVGTTTGLFSFDAPLSPLLLARASPGNLPVSDAAHNLSLAAAAGNFPVSGANRTLSLGAVAGLSGGGFGGWDPSLRARVAVTAAVRVGTAAVPLSFDAPALGAPLSRRNLPSKVGPAQLVVLHTSNGGAAWGWHSVQARAGGTACEASEWESDSAVACKAGAGGIPGQAVPLALTVALQESPFTVGTAARAVSYDRPALSSLAPRNSPAAGSQVRALLAGQNLGVRDSSAAGARVGFTACEGTQWVSHSSLACKVARGFSRPRLAVVLSIAGASATLSEAFTFDVPRFSSVGKEIPQAGAAVVLELLGRDFGMSDMSLAAKVGTDGCVDTVWASDTSI